MTIKITPLETLELTPHGLREVAETLDRDAARLARIAGAVPCSDSPMGRRIREKAAASATLAMTARSMADSMEEHAEHTHRCWQCGRGYSPARGEGPCTRRPCDGGIFTRG